VTSVSPFLAKLVGSLPWKPPNSTQLSPFSYSPFLLSPEIKHLVFFFLSRRWFTDQDFYFFVSYFALLLCLLLSPSAAPLPAPPACSCPSLLPISPLYSIVSLLLGPFFSFLYQFQRSFLFFPLTCHLLLCLCLSLFSPTPCSPCLAACFYLVLFCCALLRHHFWFFSR